MGGVSDGGGLGGSGPAAELEWQDPAEMVQQRDFRPPPGFMEKKLEGVAGEDLGSGGADELPDSATMLMTLRTNSAPWPEMARYMPALRACGVSPGEIQEASGLEPSEQNALNGAANVYASIKKSGSVSEEVLDFLLGTHWPMLLYKMRDVPVDMRCRTVEFMHARGMGGDTKAVLELIRAVGDLVSRLRASEVSVPDAFDGGLAGDCWAYRHYLNAIEETRNMERRATLARKGSEVAESEAARGLLQALAEATEQGAEVSPQGEVIETAAGPPAVELLSANLSVSTVETHVLPFLEEIPSGTSVQDALAACTASRPSGVFGVVKGSGWNEFVPTPAYPQISQCESPVALYTQDVIAVPHLKKNTPGPALVIVDTGSKGDVQPGGLYLVADAEGAPGGWSLRTGADLGGAEPLALATICLRPPSASQLVADEDGDEGGAGGGFF